MRKRDANHTVERTVSLHHRLTPSTTCLIEILASVGRRSKVAAIEVAIEDHAKSAGIDVLAVQRALTIASRRGEDYKAVAAGIIEAQAQGISISEWVAAYAAKE